MSAKQAPFVVVLLLLAVALFVEGSKLGNTVQSDIGMGRMLRSSRLSRHMLAAVEPLRVKLYTDDFQPIEGELDGLQADILAVNDFAVANNQQGLVYTGTVDSNTVETELNASSFEVLLVYTWNEYVAYATVFPPDVQAVLERALATGNLKKLMVWHSWNVAGISSGVPGVSAAAECTTFGQPAYNVMEANADLYKPAGPNGSITQSIVGQQAAHWSCDAFKVKSLHSSAMVHTWAGDENHVTAFSFCSGLGSVFYSASPANGYWYIKFDHLCNRFPDMCRFHANAMYIFIYNLECPPPTCPPSPVLSSSWLPPNSKMTRVSLAAVPTFDPHVPGNVSITGVQYFDSSADKQAKFPLAQWTSSGADGKAWVSVRAQRNGDGNGRWYRIQYTATNEAGTCADAAYVCIPHDASAFVPVSRGAGSATTGSFVSTLSVNTRKSGCPDPASIGQSQWMSTEKA